MRLSDLPQPLQQLFEQAFDANYDHNYDHRPAAQTWETALATLLGQLAVCSKNPQHKHYQGTKCPWCEVHTLMRRASPVSAGLLAGRGLDIGGELQRLWQQIGLVSPPQPPQPLHLISAGAALPALPLNLPSKPRLSQQKTQKLKAFKWSLRSVGLLLLIWAAGLLQHSDFGLIYGLFFGLLLLLVLSQKVWIEQVLWVLGKLESWVVLPFIPEQRHYDQYHEAYHSQQVKIATDLEYLRLAHSTLEQQYAQQNAYSEYLQALQALSDRRQQVLQLHQREQENLSTMLSQYERTAKNAYLRNQRLQIGVISQLDDGLLKQLTSKGIRTALDIQAQQLQDIPAHWANRLLKWRDSLEAAYRFNPQAMPVHVLGNTKGQYQQLLLLQLRELEKQVQQFKTTAWGQQEQVLAGQIQDVKRRIAQHENALELLEKLAI